MRKLDRQNFPNSLLIAIFSIYRKLVIAWLSRAKYLVFQLSFGVKESSRCANKCASQTAERFSRCKMCFISAISARFYEQISKSRVWAMQIISRWYAFLISPNPSNLCTWFHTSFPHRSLNTYLFRLFAA